MRVEGAIVQDGHELFVVEIACLVPPLFPYKIVQYDLVFRDEGGTAGDHAVGAHLVSQETHEVPTAQDRYVQKLFSLIVLIGDAAYLKGDDILGLLRERKNVVADGDFAAHPLVVEHHWHDIGQPKEVVVGVTIDGRPRHDVVGAGFSCDSSDSQTVFERGIYDADPNRSGTIHILHDCPRRFPTFFHSVRVVLSDLALYDDTGRSGVENPVDLTENAIRIDFVRLGEWGH